VLELRFEFEFFTSHCGYNISAVLSCPMNIGYNCEKGETLMCIVALCCYVSVVARLWEKDSMWQAEMLHSTHTGFHAAKKDHFPVVLCHWCTSEVYCHLLRATHCELGPSCWSAS